MAEAPLIVGGTTCRLPQTLLNGYIGKVLLFTRTILIAAVLGAWVNCASAAEKPAVAKAKRTRELWKSQGSHHSQVLSPPGSESLPLALDLPLLISQLDTVEREPARELIHGYRLRYDAIVPNHLLIQVETRGGPSRAQLDAMERMVREKIDRARQIAREQGGPEIRITVWVDGKESAEFSDPNPT